jgi:hypothetical protein
MASVKDTILKIWTVGVIVIFLFGWYETGHITFSLIWQSATWPFYLAHHLVFGWPDNRVCLGTFGQPLLVCPGKQ